MSITPTDADRREALSWVRTHFPGTETKVEHALDDVAQKIAAKREAEAQRDQALELQMDTQSRFETAIQERDKAWTANRQLMDERNATQQALEELCEALDTHDNAIIAAAYGRAHEIGKPTP